MENVKNRNYGIDLLRLVLMFLICLLHVIDHGGILNNVSGLKYYLYFYLYGVSYCAVDAYAIISGYVSHNRNKNYNRICYLWFQVVFYTFVLSLFFNLIDYVNGKGFDLNVVINSFLPVLNKDYWYFTAYFPLFFLMPYIDRLLESIDKKASKELLIIIFMLFSVMSVIVKDNYCSNGLSFLWLFLLYVIGVLIRKIDLFNNISSSKLIIAFIISTLITIIKVPFIASLVNNTSPTVLVSAVLIVIIFSRLKLKGNIIRKLSPLAFGVYLFHVNPYVYYGWLENRFEYIADFGIVTGVLQTLLVSLLIFALGLLFDFIRFTLFKIINIQKLCNKISDLLENTLNKLTDIIE